MRQKISQQAKKPSRQGRPNPYALKQFAIGENEDVESIHTRMSQLKTFEDEISLLRTAVRHFSSNRRELTEMLVEKLLHELTLKAHDRCGEPQTFEVITIVDEAKTALLSILERNPSDMKALRDLFQLFVFGTIQPDIAIDIIERFQTSIPQRLFTLQSLAAAYTYYADQDSAYHVHRNIAENYPELFDFHSKIADQVNEQVLETAKLPRSNKRLRGVSKKQDENAAKVHYQLGLRLEESHPEEAEREMQEALRRDFGHPESRCWLAKQSEKMGQVGEAREHYDICLKHHEDNLYGMNSYAILLETHFSEWNTAKDLYIRCLELEPNSATTHYNLCCLLRDHFDDYDGALKYCRRYLELEPEDPDGYGMQGHLLAQLERREEAKRAYERCLELDPDHAVVHIYYGELLATQFDQPREAKHWMEKSIILDPTFAASHNSYAQLIFKHFEEVKTARKHYNKAIELNPLNLIYHENLVYLLETINDLDAIRFHWNHWISEFPSNIEFHLKYGSFLHYDKDYDLAKQQYEICLEIDNTREDIIVLMNLLESRTAES